MALRLEHISITVENLDRSLEFYRDLLGFEVKQIGEVDAPYIGEIVGADGTVIRLAELYLQDDVLLELFEYRYPLGSAVKPRTWDPGATHIAFKVDDLDTFWARLKDARVPTRSDAPVSIDDDRWPGARCAYISDPDGVTIEIGQA